MTSVSYQIKREIENRHWQREDRKTKNPSHSTTYLRIKTIAQFLDSTSDFIEMDRLPSSISLRNKHRHGVDSVVMLNVLYLPTTTNCVKVQAQVVVVWYDGDFNVFYGSKFLNLMFFAPKGTRQQIPMARATIFERAKYSNFDIIKWLLKKIVAFDRTKYVSFCKFLLFWIKILRARAFQRTSAIQITYIMGKRAMSSLKLQSPGENRKHIFHYLKHEAYSYLEARVASH